MTSFAERARLARERRQSDDEGGAATLDEKPRSRYTGPDSEPVADYGRPVEPGAPTAQPEAPKPSDDGGDGYVDYLTWRQAVWASGLPARWKLVALAVGEHATWSTGRDAHMSVGTLADWTSCGRTVVREALRGLVVTGWLAITQESSQGNRPRQYALRHPD